LGKLQRQRTNEAMKQSQHELREDTKKMERPVERLSGTRRQNSQA
jgi:hypothetical protein